MFPNVFCQEYEISHGPERLGDDTHLVTAALLALEMFESFCTWELALALPSEFQANAIIAVQTLENYGK